MNPADKALSEESMFYGERRLRSHHSVMGSLPIDSISAREPVCPSNVSHHRQVGKWRDMGLPTASETAAASEHLGILEMLGEGVMNSRL